MADDIDTNDPEGPAVRQHLLTLAAAARPLLIDADALAGRVKRQRAVRRAVAGGVALGVVLAGSVAAVQLIDHRDVGPPATTSPGTGPTPTPGHGSLTDSEFDLAVAAARAETEKDAATVTSATATIGEGAVTDPNAGPPCTSGMVFHIKLIGTFPHIVVAPPPTAGAPNAGNDYTVSAVLITADAVSGKACLISVLTGPTTPDPGAALLFTN